MKYSESKVKSTLVILSLTVCNRLAMLSILLVSYSGVSYAAEEVERSRFFCMTQAAAESFAVLQFTESDAAFERELEDCECSYDWVANRCFEFVDRGAGLDIEPSPTKTLDQFYLYRGFIHFTDGTERVWFLIPKE